MDGKSLDIIAGRLEKLKSDFPEVFTEGKIDFEKFKAVFSDEINLSNERYVLNWAGKSDAFRTLQIPTTATLKPQPSESVNFETSGNVFIEGENLEVLKVLQKSYYGKIKCIIIDPPYNTGNDSFIYPDSFKENREEYQKRVGEKDEEGYLMKEGMFRKNSKENGHYHSNWLSMMYPRLFLAKNLMREDGVIFVHIDDNEVHNLRMIMNEIFGEENFVCIFPWRKRTAKSDVPFGVSQDYEWVLCYCKYTFNAGLNIDRKYYKTDDYPEDRWRLSDLTTQKVENDRPNSAFDLVDPKTKKIYKYNPKRLWGITKDTFDEYYKKGKIVFPDDYDFLNITIPAYRVFESEDKAKAFIKYGSEEAKKAVSTFLPKEVGMSEDGNKEIVRLFEQKIFSYPKPSSLAKHFLKSINDSDSFILDFFAGSGTTAQAVLELNKEDGGNRKFILVQLPELCDENSEAAKAGYKTIADISRERIRRVIKNIETELSEESKKKSEQIDFGDTPASKPIDLGFKAFKLSASNFKIWRSSEITEGNLEEQLEAFTDPVREGSEEENMLFELIIKAGYMITDSAVKKENIWLINGGELIIAIESVNQQTVDAILALKPRKVITLDVLFKDNDQLKTNTILQFRDAEIDFRTI